MRVRINIDGIEIAAEQGQTILSAALENGIEIPHLCFDERLEAYGGCGLCIVEVEGMPKLARACATMVGKGMVIKTNTERTIKARKTALSMLVSDHRGDCRPPCRQGCPAGTDIQGYVGLVANGQYEEALKLIKEQIPIPASIGRVCPHPCETECRRQFVEEPISIACIKSFAADRDLASEFPYMPEVADATGKRVAVVGAGPAGLSAANYLAIAGHDVEIFEAMPKPGGMIRYGIPQYRLPKEIVDAEVELIERLGVKINYGVKVGEDITLDYLTKQYDAVFLGIGAWQSSAMRCKGEDTPGVMGGIDLLIDVAQNHRVELGKKVIVVGGGNTAMDVARTCIRLGADEVRVVYRRDEDSMPAEKIEIKEAKEEGVIFSFLNGPVEVMSENGRVSGLKCEVMKLGEVDASGRRSPEPTGETCVFEADTIVAAIGQQLDLGNIDVEQTKRRTIAVDGKTYRTSVPGVFAGGDAVSGPKIAIEAIAQGKQAAIVIDAYLDGEDVEYHEPSVIVQKDFDKESLKDREKQARVEHHVVDAAYRRKNFQPILETMTEKEAQKEASRCLECGCKEYFDCQLIKYVQEYNIDTTKDYGEKEHKFISNDHPFVIQNQEKCVQCGLCVRVCKDIVGQAALGLVNRGFEAVVAPEFENPLKETSCISCGQCIDVCPTAAWMERCSELKEIPLQLDKTESVCGYCSVGCLLNYEHKGDKVYRVSNVEGSADNLCVRGRFGYEYVNDNDRLLTARANGRHIGLDEGLYEVAKRLRAVQDMEGDGKTAFIVSPKLTNEELCTIKHVASEVGSHVLGSFTVPCEGGVETVLGTKYPVNTIDAIDNADFILAVGDVYENHPATGMRIKKASQTAKVMSLSENGAKIDEWGVAIKADGSLLPAVLKVIADGKISVDISISECAQKVADAIKAAKRPMIIVDECSVAANSIKIIADIAVLTNNVKGLLVLMPKANSLGAWDCGFTYSGCEIMELMRNGDIKSVVIVGENPVAHVPEFAELMNKMRFSAVFDIYESETSKNAEFVLPLASTPESCGTFTSFDGSEKEVVPAIEPVLGYDNLDMFEIIKEHLDGEEECCCGCCCGCDCEEEVTLYTPDIKPFGKEYRIFDTVEAKFSTKIKNI